MPKVTGPLFSLAASGRFRDAIEFRTVGNRTVVAAPGEAKAPRSPAQRQQSQRFAAAVAAWKALDATQRQAWRTAAHNTGLTGYQLYLSEYQTQNVGPPNQPVVP